MENTKSELRIVFDKSATNFILDLFNKTVNEDKEIVEKDRPDVKVLSFPEGVPLLEKDFGGIQKGSELFIKDNFVSLMKLEKKRKHE